MNTSSLQYKPDQQEVDRYDDTEDGDGSPLVGQTQPEEEIQEKHVQQVVHSVAQSKTYTFLGRRLGSEGEIVGSQEIADKTDQITNAIGHRNIHFRPQPKHSQIDAVMQCRCQHAHNAEADDFSYFFILVQSHGSVISCTLYSQGIPPYPLGSMSHS